MKLGTIIIFNATKGGWFSSAQRFFTRMPFTHVGGYIGTVVNEESIFEALEAVAVTPWSRRKYDETMQYYVYEPNDSMITSDATKKTLNEIYNAHAGNTYGFFQLLWFVYRWIGESWPFKADMRKFRNWFPGGSICSEVWYDYLTRLGYIYPEIEKVLSEWPHANTVHAGDMYDIMQALCIKGYYKLVQLNNVIKVPIK
jgi:hypothetical protein